MEFRFDPWMLDVDVLATQKDYTTKDYSKDKFNKVLRRGKLVSCINFSIII